MPAVFVNVGTVLAGSLSNLKPVYENVTGSALHKTFLGGTLSIIASAPFFLAGFETIPQKNVKKADLDLAGAIRRAAEVQGRIKDSVDRLSEKIADWTDSDEDR